MAITLRGGVLFNADGSVYEGPLDGTVSAATTAAAGTVKKVAAQADFAGADLAALKVELNAWKALMVTAGIQT